jgi:hypothetical protein
MLKDNFSYKSLIGNDSLSVPLDKEITQILSFVDTSIVKFFAYYINIKDSERENRITDYLIDHFQACKYEQSDGFLPYDFRKNPTQEQSSRETDIGVFVPPTLNLPK